MDGGGEKGRAATTTHARDFELLVISTLALIDLLK